MSPDIDLTNQVHFILHGDSSGYCGGSSSDGSFMVTVVVGDVDVGDDGDDDVVDGDVVDGDGDVGLVVAVTNQWLAWCCSLVRSVLAVHYKIITPGQGEVGGLVSISSDNGAAPA